MRGSIRQRGDNSWQLRVHVGIDPLTRRHVYKARTFRGSKRDAQRALSELVSEADGVSPRSGKGISVGALLDQWLEHATPGFSARTVVVTRDYINNAIKPMLGPVPVAKLTTADIDRLYTYLRTVGGAKGPYLPATIRRVHGILRRALSQGVKWSLIRQNPAIDSSPPRIPYSGIRSLQPSELSLLFQSAQERDPALATFLTLAASTGARRGELIALRWRNVDLDRGRVTIERGIVVVGPDLVEQRDEDAPNSHGGHRPGYH